jgi:hypothetical protein
MGKNEAGCCVASLRQTFDRHSADLGSGVSWILKRIHKFCASPVVMRDRGSRQLILELIADFSAARLYEIRRSAHYWLIRSFSRPYRLFVFTYSDLRFVIAVS